MHSPHLPIGVFDSGVGGLTVLRVLQERLPNEHFLYLGDTARLPYGTKSPDTVKQYALNAAEILVNKGIKALVVACNTASAVAREVLQEKFHPLPVLGVIASGAKASIPYATTSNPIIVLATESTVKWHAYRHALLALAPDAQVIEWPCSLLVALAEEGWCQGILVEQIISKVLSPLFSFLGGKRPACVLLGCTHFPPLKSAIQAVMGSPIPVIDPAHTVADALISLLSSQPLFYRAGNGSTRFMATDGVERFAQVAQTFLGYSIAAHEVEWVTVPASSSTFLKEKTAG